MSALTEVEPLIFQLHFVSTLFMTGLIWTIQMVHYPAFRFVDRNSFTEFEDFHCRNISKIVLPMMLLELSTCIALLASKDSFNSLLAINFLLLALTWLITLLLSSKYHKSLSTKFDSQILDKLISSNWSRTFSWSFRSILLAYLSISN